MTGTAQANQVFDKAGNLSVSARLPLQESPTAHAIVDKLPAVKLQVTTNTAAYHAKNHQ
jgi:hypothetical protein